MLGKKIYKENDAKIKKVDIDKKYNEDDEKKLIQGVLDVNKKIVNDILGEEDELDTVVQNEGENREGSFTKYSNNKSVDAVT